MTVLKQVARGFAYGLAMSAVALFASGVAMLVAFLCGVPA